MIPPEGQAALADSLQQLAVVARGLAEIAEDLRSDLEVQAEPEAPSETRRESHSKPVTTSTPESLLTARDLAAYLGIDPRTLRRWRHERRVPKPLKLKGVPRWRRADVDRFLRERAS